MDITQSYVVLIDEPLQGLRANPSLKTMNQIETVLREAFRNREPPLSYRDIERRLPARRVDFYVIQAAVMDLVRRRWAIVGSDGVMWIVPDEARQPSVPLA